jgi:iron complex transport system permease protein
MVASLSGGIALMRARAFPLLVVGLTILLVVLMIWALCTGRYPVSAAAVLHILSGWTAGAGVVPGVMETNIVIQSRGPRVAMAAICGAGLALGGAAMQGIFRNPLVSPHILGVSFGASLGGVLAILIGYHGMQLVGLAFFFGFVTLMLVASLSRVGGRSSTVMVILTGIVIGSLFSAFVSLVKFVADPDSSLPAIVFWLMGSFATSSWNRVAFAAPAIALGACIILAMRFRINVLSIGDDDARSLGIPVERDRSLVFVAVALIEGAIVAFAGVVGWVGLIVPHAARMLVGIDQRKLLPVSALLGANYLLLIDTLARSLTAAEIPVGIITAILGTPVFAIMLRNRARQEAGE